MLVKQELKHFEKYTEQLLKYVTITVFKGSFKYRNANNMIRSRNFILKAFMSHNLFSSKFDFEILKK